MKFRSDVAGRLTGREPTPEEWAALARRKAELQRGKG
jgi:hypothetical protein